eukprot:scaffold72072_cov43-Phaeocystis_antarctica.AAC.3
MPPGPGDDTTAARAKGGECSAIFSSSPSQALPFAEVGCSSWPFSGSTTLLGFGSGFGFGFGFGFGSGLGFSRQHDLSPLVLAELLGVEAEPAAHPAAQHEHAERDEAQHARDGARYGGGQHDGADVRGGRGRSPVLAQWRWRRGRG